MDYLFIVTALLFLPGIALTYLLGLDRYRFLLSFSLSYSLFVFLLKSMPLIGFSAEAFKYIYILIIIILLILVTVKYYFSIFRRVGRFNVRCLGCNSFSQSVAVMIVIFIALYLYLVGAYVELPSDVFQHLVATEIGKGDLLELDLAIDLSQGLGAG